MNMAERNPCVYNRLEPYEKKLARDRILNSTLSDICLNSIVKHFDRHMVAHKSGRIPKHYEFLQRTASKKLFNMLCISELGWRSTYSDFLINPYIKELSTFAFHKIGFPVENLYGIGKTLTNLDIIGSAFTEHLLYQLVGNLPNIKSLTISSTFLSSRVLQNCMEYCTCLESLQLDGSISDRIIYNVFGDEDAGNEFPCKAILKEFQIESTHVTAIGISFLLEYFPNLIRVANDYTAEAMFTIYNKDMVSRVPVKVYKFEKLLLDYHHFVAPVLPLCSVLCPHLVELRVGNLKSQAQIDALVGFVTLEKVIFHVRKVIFDVNSSNVSFSTFIKQNGKKLKVFKVRSENYVNISSESLLEFCPNLEVLELNRVVFEPMQEEYLSEQKLHRMKHLSLASKLSLPSSIKSLNAILSSLPNLKVLDLSYCESVSWNIDSIIANCSVTSIRELDIKRTNVNEYDINKILLAFPVLEKFTIPRHLFSDILQFSERLPPHVNKVWIDTAFSYVNGWIAYLSQICELKT